VVGGGVVGAGVARDAALRGLAVAVVEAGDWASGTSSRTTKFAHGGLRYLEERDFGLVRTALRERATLLRIAPHLTRATPFLLPIHRGSRPPWQLRIGLGLYDVLARGARLGRHRVVDAAEARAREPLLSPRGLRGAGVYWDARVRDARLVVETIADARRAGAVAASRCAVRALEPWSGGWTAEVEDRRGGERFLLRGRAWINATGPWADRLRAMAASGRGPLLAPTKGAHVVVSRERLPLRDPTAFFAGDGRLVFAVPEGDWTFIGTTDTPDGGDVDDFAASDGDVDYLLAAASGAFEPRLSRGDVRGAWAGWRPLVRAARADRPGAIPRDEAMEATAPRFLTVSGGKLTTYRAMAEEAVDGACETLGRPRGACATALRPLVPASVGGAGPPRGAPPASVARVRELFGPDADDVFDRWRAAPETGEPLADGFPYTAAEVERAAREMVETLGDLVDRRLSVLPEGLPVGGPALERVAAAAAPVLGWSEARVREEVARFRAPAI